jgi:uncharacterized lipoprotein YajG
MDFKTHGKHMPLAILSLAAVALFAAGCGSGSTATTTTTTQTAKGSSFLVGTDAPMASVTSFAVQVESVSATDSNNNTVQLLSGSPTVDFARLMDFRPCST